MDELDDLYSLPDDELVREFMQDKVVDACRAKIRELVGPTILPADEILQLIRNRSRGRPGFYRNPPYQH